MCRGAVRHRQVANGPCRAGSLECDPGDDGGQARASGVEGEYSLRAIAGVVRRRHAGLCNCPGVRGATPADVPARLSRDPGGRGRLIADRGVAASRPAGEHRRIPHDRADRDQIPPPDAQAPALPLSVTSSSDLSEPLRDLGHSPLKRPLRFRRSLPFNHSIKQG